MPSPFELIASLIAAAFFGTSLLVVRYRFSLSGHQALATHLFGVILLSYAGIMTALFSMPPYSFRQISGV